MTDSLDVSGAGITIRASYAAEAGAREAAAKLQLLRASAVNGDEAGILTATVNPDVVDRALHLIRQTGGEPEAGDYYS